VCVCVIDVLCVHNVYAVHVCEYEQTSCSKKNMTLRVLSRTGTLMSQCIHPHSVLVHIGISVNTSTRKNRINGFTRGTLVSHCIHPYGVLVHIGVSLNTSKSKYRINWFTHGTLRSQCTHPHGELVHIGV